MDLLKRMASRLFRSTTPVSSHAADFTTPEGAIRCLGLAYIEKDIEAMVGAKDFAEEARLMLQAMNPEMAGDVAILRQTAEVLELAFRKEIQDSGFPDFESLQCFLFKPVHITATLVRVDEKCVFPDGSSSVQRLHVFKGENGWRVVNVPD